MKLIEQLVESEHVCDFDDEGIPHHKVRITLDRAQLVALRNVAAAAWLVTPLANATVVENARTLADWCGNVEHAFQIRTGETL